MKNRSPKKTIIFSQATVLHVLFFFIFITYFFHNKLYKQYESLEQQRIKLDKEILFFTDERAKTQKKLALILSSPETFFIWQARTTLAMGYPKEGVYYPPISS